jgi:glycosyltransferase involved in cell wall biosynthesis
MQLLFLTPQLPYPPRQGTTIRNYNLLRHLARRCTIDLLTFLAPGETLAADSPLHGLCRRVAAVPQPARSPARRMVDTVTTLTPDMGLRLQSAAMLALVQAWTAQTAYDIVQVEGIELVQYGLAATRPGAGSSAPALVFDNHNCEYLLQQRNAFNDLRLPRRWPAALYSLVQWRKLVRYEAAALLAASASAAVSEADKQAMLRIAPAADITVISNGIDLQEYRPESAPQEPPARAIAGTAGGALTTGALAGGDLAGGAPRAGGAADAILPLVFTGKMDYRPNIDAALWFAQEVLPLITAQEPAACLQLVGMNPHRRLDVLAGQPNIQITGAVADTRPYIHAAAVYIIPMRVGGGTRFKALEAMACARPIVSTALGVEGIPVTDGVELLLADTPGAFAAAVLRLLADRRAGGQPGGQPGGPGRGQDGPLGRALGAAARRFVEERYAWDTIVPQFDQLYQRVKGA